jgi:single-stranded-DNA-specific exonuclease
LRQLLYNRQIAGPNLPRLSDHQCSLHDPFLLLIWNGAVSGSCGHRLPRAHCRYGDYDVRWVTATALLVQVLRAWGEAAIHPNRFDEGYGLNNEAPRKPVPEGIRLVNTVDCGIRSPRRGGAARQLAWT